MKSIVITGSTSGIGYGLANSFLGLGCSVTVSGRSQANLDKTASELGSVHESGRIFSVLCDVTDFQQVTDLWNAAKAHFGKVDIWINNAGLAHAETVFPDYAPEAIKEVAETNIIGTIYGATVAFKGMREQGFGGVYNLEGLGSDGRIIKGMAVYGTTKAAVTYLTKAMAKEAQGTPVLVGGLRPGMTVTKLITAQYEGHPEEWERVKGIFNILSDRVESVTPWLAEKILNNTKNDVTFTWLSRRKLLGRFLQAPFYKRNVFD